MRQMTTDFFVADAVLPKAIPVIPTVLSRHPDRSLPSSRPPLHVIPTATPRHPDRSGGISQQARDDAEAFRDPSTSLRVTGKCMALATKKSVVICRICVICVPYFVARKGFAIIARRFRAAREGFAIIARRFRTARRALQSLQNDFAPCERLYNHCKMISHRAKGSAIIAK